MYVDHSLNTPSYKSVSIPAREKRNVPVLEDLPRFKVLSGQSLWRWKDGLIWAILASGYFGLGEQMLLAFLLQSYIVAAGK